MLNKLCKILTSYQFFFANSANTFLSERKKLFFFTKRISQVVNLVQLSYHESVFSSIIAWSWWLQKIILLIEVVYQRGKIPCTWTWAQKFFQKFVWTKNETD